MRDKLLELKKAVIELLEIDEELRDHVADEWSWKYVLMRDQTLFADDVGAVVKRNSYVNY